MLEINFVVTKYKFYLEDSLFVVVKDLKNLNVIQIQIESHIIFKCILTFFQKEILKKLNRIEMFSHYIVSYPKAHSHLCKILLTL